MAGQRNYNESYLHNKRSDALPKGCSSIRKGTEIHFGGEVSDYINQDCFD